MNSPVITVAFTYAERAIVGVAAVVMNPVPPRIEAVGTVARNRVRGHG